MTESIVRDPNFDGHWFVYIDGLLAGELMARLDDSGWPAGFSYMLVNYHYTMVIPSSSVGNFYRTLAEAENQLVQTYKANVLGVMGLSS